MGRIGDSALSIVYQREGVIIIAMELPESCRSPIRVRFKPMQRDGVVLNMVLRIFLRVIAQSLQAHSPSAASADRAALHIGAVALAKPQVHIHRFGSSLNAHVHFHVCVVDGVFEKVAGVVDGDAKVSPVDAGVTNAVPGSTN